MDLMKADSYSPYVNMQDVDPWTDENGELHRNPLDLKVAKIELEIAYNKNFWQIVYIKKGFVANFN